MAFSPVNPAPTPSPTVKGNVFAATPGLEPDARLSVLLTMLTYMRPAFSDSERVFIKRFIKPLGVVQDGFGNVWKRIDNLDGTPSRVMFSCHTDTVHSVGGKQAVTFDTNKGVIYTTNGDCLGADDTAGIWLMREMIIAKVPGLYVFHRAEEVGGRGSRYIADHTPDLVAGIDACIALDRMGFESIITHQAGGRCCSDNFARSLARILPDMDLMADDTGLFTDSANYTDLIPECTNLSVGYQHAHSPRETQHARFLVDMRNALIGADWQALTIERNPAEPYPYAYAGYGSRKVSWTDHFDWIDDEPVGLDSLFTPARSRREDELFDLVCEHPDAVAALLSAHGVTPDEIRELAWRSR